MLRMSCVPAAGLVLGLAAAGCGHSGSLGVGDPAPKIEVKEFVRGEPVTTFEKGKVYVVAFWAVRSEGSKNYLAPLNELAQDHKDVTVMVVCLGERDGHNVKQFFDINEPLSKTMAFRVAIDKDAGDYKDKRGAMAQAWVAAAGQDWTLTGFIVDKDGRIACIGPAWRMDVPLDEIAAGTWDLKAEAARLKEEKAQEDKVRELGSVVLRGMHSDDMKNALAAVDDYVKDHPVMKRAVAEVLPGPTSFLMGYTGGSPDRNLPAKTTQAAVDAAAKAVELTQGRNASNLDILAFAHFLNGDVAKAIEVEEKALKLTPNRKTLQEHMTTFRKAKEKKKDDK